MGIRQKLETFKMTRAISHGRNDRSLFMTLPLVYCDLAEIRGGDYLRVTQDKDRRIIIEKMGIK